MTVYEYTNMFAHIWLVRKFVSVSRKVHLDVTLKIR